MPLAPAEDSAGMCPPVEPNVAADHGCAHDHAYRARETSMDRFATIGSSVLFCGRSEHITPHIPDSMVDLFVEDPPYYKILDQWWDRQWDTSGAFLGWMREIVRERFRLLAPTGSYYLFCFPELVSPIRAILEEFFHVLNEIRWVKSDHPLLDPSGYNRKQVKDRLRSYWSPWECVFFCEHYGSDQYAKGERGYQRELEDVRGFLYDSIRDYIAGEFRRAGIPYHRADEFTGTASMASRHYFSPSQWWLPLPEHYTALQAGLNAAGRTPAPPFAEFHAYPRTLFEHTDPDRYLAADHRYLRAEFDRLRHEYDRLRDNLEDRRRPFFATDALYTDLWYYMHVPAGQTGRHPAQKPEDLIADIIRTASRPGALIADFFMGSGTTAAAAARLDRRFVGGDVMPEWCAATARRLSAPSPVDQLSFLEDRP